MQKNVSRAISGVGCEGEGPESVVVGVVVVVEEEHTGLRELITLTRAGSQYYRGIIIEFE